MTKEDAIKNVESAFVAALTSGVEEEVLFEALFQVSISEKATAVGEFANDIFRGDTQWLKDMMGKNG